MKMRSLNARVWRAYVSDRRKKYREREKTIMHHTKKHHQIAVLVVAASLLAAPMALADAVTDWNIKAGEIVVEAKLGPPPANRVLAIVQAAVSEAVNAVTKRYPASELQLEAASDASVEAAIAAANHATLAKLVPSQQAAIDTAYNAALAGIADGPAKSAGIEVGDKAAAAILAGRADDGAGAACRAVSTPTAAATTSSHPRRAKRLPKSGSPRSDGRSTCSVSSIFRLIRRRPGAARSACSPRCRIAWRRS